jgi:hypothetical protein
MAKINIFLISRDEHANLEMLKDRLLKISTTYLSNIINQKENIPILLLIIQQVQIEFENQNIKLHRKIRKTCLDEYQKNIKILSKNNILFNLNFI